MIPAIIRQASLFKLAQPQPEYRRFLHGRIDFNERLIGVKGARGSGKTTLLLQHAAGSGIPGNKILYVACDHPAMVDQDLYAMAQVFYQEGGELFLIDEIHKAARFAGALKAIHDTFGLQVIFSGSSALRIEHELADLSRRAVVYTMPVLSFREFLEIETGRSFPVFSLAEITGGHQAISSEICAAVRPIEHFKEYLRNGAYPFFIESRQTYLQKLLEVVNITIDSDLCGLYNIEPRKLDKLKKILYMLCSTPPVELNKSKLSSAVGTSWPTLSRYLERMQAGSLIHSVRAGTGMRTINRPDKLLLNNPNMFHALCAMPDTGAIRETFFVSQLSYRHQVHYHDQGDFIVDDSFVFEIGGPGKTTRQLGGRKNSYVAADEIVTGAPWQIPLWIFGLNY
jgi:predicted AAA+ superfamily ATPase